MRIFITLFSLLCFATLVVAQAPQLPIDFESTDLEYAFSDFEGGVATVIDNPDASGINTSAKVGQMVKNDGATFGGSTLALAGPIDFGENNAVSMKVWANRVDAPVLFKLEGPTPIEVEVNTTVANEWEELVFSFAGFTAFEFTGITLIYDLGTVGDGSADFTLYFDDIALTTVSEEGSVQLPITFEDPETDYVFSDFGGGVATIIDNPDISGINTSANVAQLVKNEGEVFGGSTLALAGPVDFGENNAISMKVWANRVGAPVLLKLEGPTPVQVEMNTTVANQWEELTFSFAGLTTGVYPAITVIYDLGVVGDGSADFTLYFDDLQLSTVAGVQLPIDFESADLDYAFADFEGGMATVIDNPDASGINTSAKVGQMVKNGGAPFGGSTLLLADPIDFGENNAISMKVWANRIDAPVLFKLEGPTPVEVEVNTTVANEWEELVFNFDGLTTGVYTAITLIYDLGTVGDGSADFTLYFDDIALTTAAEVIGVQLPITFEDAEVDYVFTDFEGGVATVIDNPDASGINTSAKVGQMVKNDGAVFGGSTLALDGPIEFGENNAVSMKVWANRVDAPVLFKLEGPSPIEVEVNTTVANEWEELVFSFAGFTELEFTAITLIYDLGTVGDGSADFTFYFDDIALATVSEEGSVQLPITFEDPDANYVFSDFAGGVATIIDNPDVSGINTSANVAQLVKNEGEVFGGSTLALTGPIDFGENNAISMKVWANRVDGPVLLKLEGPTPVEVEMNTTVANQWEDLTFSFAGLTTGVYTAITVIYDLGVVGDGSADFTLYFDDLQLTIGDADAGVQLPITFEDPELDYVFTDFEGGVATVIDNPDASGINTSDKVAQMVKNTGAPFAGSTLALGGPIDFGDNTAITMKVWANRVDAPVLFKLEGPTPVEVEVNTTVANEWEELTFDLTGFTSGVYTAITIIYDLGTVGDGSADFTLYFDDIQFPGTSSVTDLDQLPVQLYPNPAGNQLTVSAPEAMESIRIFDLTGRQVYFERTDRLQRDIDLSGLSAGTYLLQIRTGNRQRTVKFVRR